MRLEILAFLLVSSISSIVSFSYYVINYYASRSSKKEKSSEFLPMGYTSNDITAVIPVRNENPEKFANSIKAIIFQVSRVIVIGDGVSSPYREICSETGAEFIALPERSGKRVAMAEGISRVNTPVTLFMDSDATPSSDAVKAVLSDFRSNVGGVGGNIRMNLDDENPYAYASEFFERSKETVQRSMKRFGNVMLIDASFAAYRTEIVKDFIMSGEFKNFRINGKIPYYGGGDDAELTSYVIRRGYLSTKSFEADVVVEPKRDFHSLFSQLKRWSRTSWRSFFKNLRNGTFRKANRFYKIEQLLTYTLPVLVFSAILFKAAFYFLLLTRIGFRPVEIAMILMQFPKSRILHLYNIISYTSTFSSTFFLSTVIGGKTKKKLKLLIYGAGGTFMLFIATITGLFTYHRI